jgi:hypothetical protein
MLNEVKDLRVFNKGAFIAEIGESSSRSQTSRILMLYTRRYQILGQIYQLQQGVLLVTILGKDMCHMGL